MTKAGNSKLFDAEEYADEIIKAMNDESIDDDTYDAMIDEYIRFLEDEREKS